MSALQRSRLVAGRAIGPDDARIVERLSTLVMPQRMDQPWRCELVGITNSEGLVYREVMVCSALELVSLTATLNSAGYSVDRASKLQWNRYARILSKRS